MSVKQASAAWMGDTVSPRRHEYASLVMSVPDKYAFKATDKQTNEKKGVAIT